MAAPVHTFVALSGLCIHDALDFFASTTDAGRAAAPSRFFQKLGCQSFVCYISIAGREGQREGASAGLDLKHLLPMIAAHPQSVGCELHVDDQGYHGEHCDQRDKMM
jgi:hypothetical protein